MTDLTELNSNQSNQMRELKVSLITFGCQMNEYDSEVASGLLEHQGFQLTPDEGAADVVLMNTCSVREHAEERVYGRLGMLGKVKKTNPNLIVGLMGCMVEEHRKKLFKRFPQLDFMIGTRNIRELPTLIDEVIRTRKQIAKIKQDGISIEYTDLIKRGNPFHAWLPIMTGCDKVCTYCIVPITRGREVSMPAGGVYREASRLVSEGVKWITLLGQNVNSYRDENSTFVIKESPKGVRKQSERSEVASTSFDLTPPNDGCIRFPELLDTLCQIDGLERISFTTSHPHDASEELFGVIARNHKVSRRFHLPLQSGSNRMLRRMKRLHTYEAYRDKIDVMRKMIPDISVTTDIITGFSGETDEDHCDTIRALEEIRYDSAFIYKYSVRPATPAAKLPDDVPLAIKEKRNAELLKIQKQITNENNRKWIGKTGHVFVEGINPKSKMEIDKVSCPPPFFSQLIGRTNQDKRVIFEGDQTSIGRFKKVELVALQHETFIGRPAI